MDTRIAQLRNLSRQIARIRQRESELEPLRAALIRELAAEMPRGRLVALAAHTGLTRGRICQIVNDKPNGGER